AASPGKLRFFRCKFQLLRINAPPIQEQHLLFQSCPVSNMFLLQRAFLITLLCTTIANRASGQLSQLPFKRIIVFGDSYSDNGFGYTFLNGTYPVSPPYAKRFSNGPVWPEYLSQITGWDLEDYACGGATTDNNAIKGVTGPLLVVVPGIAQQISDYFFPTLTPSKEAILDDEVLYVIWANGNDFGDDKLAAPPLVVSRIISSFNAIHSKIPTAKHFLALKLSGIGKIPLVTSVNQQIAPGHPLEAKIEAGFADAEDVLFNDLLQGAVELYRTEHADVKFSIFPTDQLFDNFTSQLGRADIGVKYVTEPCVEYHYANASVDITAVCTDVQDYLYWDWYHPTTHIHNLFAQAVKKFLESEYNVHTHS
ncbi:GDSL-like Lipase/Acylhydrolase-domain-containing protein, partial [Endogone sp. FLAS-F59071]